MSDLNCAKLILKTVPTTMRRIRTEMRTSARAAMADLTVPQFRILVRLSLSIATNKELAEWIGVSPPSMTRMVRHLIRKGLIKRLSVSPLELQLEGRSTKIRHDRREVRLTLTSKGQAVYQNTYEEVLSIFTDLVSKLDSENKQTLSRGLQILGTLFQ